MITSLFAKLAQSPAPTDALSKIFGSGVTGAPLSGGDVPSAFTKLFSFGINVIFVVAAIFALVYMLWGAFDYIISAGDSGKAEKARQKIINAVIGIIILIAALMLWLVITRNILGIFGGSGGGFEFKLPTIRNLQNSSTPAPSGSVCDPANCFSGTSCPTGRTLKTHQSCADSAQLCCWNTIFIPPAGP